MMKFKLAFRKALYTLASSEINDFGAIILQINWSIFMSVSLHISV